MPPDSAVSGCREGRGLHSTPGTLWGARCSAPLCMAAVSGRSLEPAARGVPCCLGFPPPGREGAGMAALRVLSLQPGPWSNTVPTPPRARPTPGGTRVSAPDSCKASGGPRESGGHAPVPALRPRGVLQPQPAPRSAPLLPPGSSRLGAHSCQRIGSAPAAAARRDDAGGARQ